MRFVSYAQNYEDVMLARALRGVEKGFYIDVGAQDPVNDSVTKAFYEMGWRGINIEPVTHWFDRLVADRPHDANLQLAVSECSGTLHLFEIVDTGLSTTDADFAQRHAQYGHQVRESEVACVTLDHICETYAVNEVHFLKIDCEGAEAAVLRGFSLGRTRPWIILLEATEPNSQTPAYAEWEPLLTGRGYHFVYEDGLNRFYVADEHAGLDGAFSHPPNVFDSFWRASEAEAHAQLAVIREDVAALRDAGQLARLQHECETLHSHVDHLRSENERREGALVEHRTLLREAAEREASSNAQLIELRQTLREADGREARLQAELLGSQNEISRLHREIASRDQEIVHRSDLLRALHRSTSWRITFPLRAAKRGAGRLARILFWALYHLLRWPARLARPLLRSLAELPWLRPVAARVWQMDGRFINHVRLFLFGRSVADEPTAEVDIMTRRTRQVLEEIHDAKKRCGSDHPSRRGRGA